MHYTIHHTPMFDKCVAAYHERKQINEVFQLSNALLELRRQPFGNPSLQTHAMKGVSSEKRFISYSGGAKGQRIIWAGFEREIVLLLFGEHDDVERRATRLDLSIDIEAATFDIVERTEAITSEIATTNSSDEHVGQLFVAWTDRELSEMGFPEHVVPVLRRMDVDDDLFDADLADEDERRAFNLLAYQDPDGPAAESVDQAEVEHFSEVVAESTEETERDAAEVVRSEASLEGVAPLDDDGIRSLLQAPIEQWMVFLHPDQHSLTTRQFNGPARVRGAAGTGKTVVALHRAAELLRQEPGRLLFTSYVKSLPVVLQHLFSRLAPDLLDRVDFRGLHSWTYRFLRDQGDGFRLNSKDVRLAADAAWASALEGTDVADQVGVTKPYVAEEVEWVLKGRDVQGLDDYLSLTRTGRGTPLTESARRGIWRYFEAYQAQLAKRNTIDFSDLMLRTLRLLEGGAAVSRYRFVFVDESQDLTEVGVRICHLLSGSGEENGLFLVGDGQQSIYPGGYSLRSVGIEVRGRSTVLGVNYRNTAQVASLAQRLMEGTTFEDGDDLTEDGLRDVKLVRKGDQAPELRGFTDVEEHDRTLVQEIRKVTGSGLAGIGDVAVLVPTNRMAWAYGKLLQQHGLAAQQLTDYEGVPTDAVKVGTYQRGKGLEFKRVFLPRLDSRSLREARATGEDESTHKDRLDLLRNAIFVAITRARDGVWLGWVDEPGRVIAAIATGRQ